MTPSDKLREISDRHLRSELNTERLTPLQWEGIMRTIENVISEHYYPKEFVEWIGREGVYKPINRDYWYYQRSKGRTFYTLDELFNYWKENEQ